MMIFISLSLKHVHTLPLLYLSFDDYGGVYHSTLTRNVTCIPEQWGEREGGDRDTRKANVVPALGKTTENGESIPHSPMNCIKRLKWVCKTIIEADSCSRQVGTNENWAGLSHAVGSGQDRQEPPNAFHLETLGFLIVSCPEAKGEDPSLRWRLPSVFEKWTF